MTRRSTTWWHGCGASASPTRRPRRAPRPASTPPRCRRSYSEASDGKILFDLHCARCHTPRWPGRGSAQLPNNGGTIEIEPGPDGAGRYGPPLNKVSLERLFPDIADHLAFIEGGAADNVPFGEFARLGNYGMPGFGRVLSDDQIRQIAEYERSLNPDDQVLPSFEQLHEPEDAE